jgi:hypothetical protein
MRSTLKSSWQLCLSVVLVSGAACGQGTFQNLNFEAARLPRIPNGQSGGYVSFSNALPGWTGYLGTGLAAEALHNDFTLGNASIGILGPYWNLGPGFNIIEGWYSAVLQAGSAIFVGNNVPAAIVQTGLIPADARSIEFKLSVLIGGPATRFRVEMGGQPVTIVPLAATANYTLYGGDIAAFAGQTAEVRFSAIPTPSYSHSSIVLDSITFSPSIIPEPSSEAVFGTGLLLVGWSLGCRRSRA